MRFLQQCLVSRCFLVLLRYFFLIFFFHFCFFDGVRFQYSQALALLLISESSCAIPIKNFNSYRDFSFPIFHYQHCKFFFLFFISNSIPILATYYYCLRQGLQFFFIFINRLILSIYVRWLILAWFCKFVALFSLPKTQTGDQSRSFILIWFWHFYSLYDMAISDPGVD